MSDVLALLSIGKSALLATQRALAVTGQNIANVNTPGYSRQTAQLATTMPMEAHPGQLGTGVAVTRIQRAVDAVVEQQRLASQAQLGRLTVIQQTLTQLQTQFGDTADQGLGAALNAFFAAWHDVATHPADAAARTVLLAKATALTEQFHRMAAFLTETQGMVDRQVGETLATINAQAQQIAALNQQIARAQASGQTPNDLLDRRTQLLNELGNQIAVSTLEETPGRLTVLVGHGHVLVSGDTAYALVGQAGASPTGHLAVLYPDESTGQRLDLSSELTGGQLAGLLIMRDTTIAGLLDAVNRLAATLVSQVNDQHAAGYGLDGSTGQAFFDATGTTAATIRVALTDPNEVAAADRAAGVPGDGANALALGTLPTAVLAALDNLTMSQYYARTAATLGATANQADGDLKAEQAIQDHLQATRAQVSGVSLDEELVNLLAQQRAFEAAARIITMTDDLLQTIVSMKR
ncbi:flagellar hook-associated protein FlgK [Nitrospira sp. Kam-Ns4a]